MFKNFKGKLTRNVVVLGVVSFLNDLSSDMIVPFLPVLFTSGLGGTTAFLGMVEGVARAGESLLQLFSGYLSQITGKRKGLTFAGYFFSSISKPLFFFAGSPIAAFIIRVSDRAGKGFRTSPRDALLSDSTSKETIGLAFGFNRALDSAGAVLGPLIGFVLISTVGLNYTWLFLVAAIPSFFSLLVLAAGVKEIPGRVLPGRPKIFGTLPKGAFLLFLAAVFFLYLGRLPDLLAILRAQELGVATSTLPLFWVLFNLTGSFFAGPFGGAFDRVPKKVLVGGWLAYLVSLLGFAFLSREFMPFLFLFFGLFDAATDGPMRAAVVRIVPADQRASAFGWYHAVRSVAFLLAGSLIGFGWQNFGVTPALTAAGGVTILGLLLLLRVRI
ncbi:MAG: MFS transporter [candidate division Zixibacteria bacterium]|nr:MFS transporter [candidate division Zixibacteria bacterium]